MVVFGVASASANFAFKKLHSDCAATLTDEVASTVILDRIILQQRGMPAAPEAACEVLPTTFADGRYLLAMDGRIDNREDLSLELGIGRHAGLPDSIILAAAWQKWGENSVEHLLGEFAFVVWDNHNCSLTLACDQTTGGRPLFYHATDDRVVFSTSLAALLTVADVPRELDQQRLAGAAQWQWPGEGATCFRAIRQLPPAGRLRWSAGRCTVDRYWRPEFSRSIRYRRDSDYVEAARELLDRAVAAHGRVAEPLVCELSGGLDSTAVAATAARLYPEREIYTVTAVSDDQAIMPPLQPQFFRDEWTLAKDLAALYPNLTALRVPAAPMQASMADPQRQFARTGMPGPNPFDSSWFDPARAEVVKLGARGVLVGASGNLTLSVDASAHLSDLAARGSWMALLSHARGLADAPGGPTMTGLLRSAARGAWLSNAEDAAIELGPAIAARYRTKSEAIRQPQATRFDAQRQGMFDRIVEARRVSNVMARTLHGIEMRDPLGYCPLVEFCFAVPPEQYLLGGVHRSLARRALADRLPPSVVQEPRRGLQCPEIAARIGGQRDWLADTLARVELSPMAADILDTEWIRSTISRIPHDLSEMGADFVTPLRRVAAALQVGQFIQWVESGCPGLDAP